MIMQVLKPPWMFTINFPVAASMTRRPLRIKWIAVKMANVLMPAIVINPAVKKRAT